MYPAFRTSVYWMSNQQAVVSDLKFGTDRYIYNAKSGYLLQTIVILSADERIGFLDEDMVFVILNLLTEIIEERIEQTRLLQIRNMDNKNLLHDFVLPNAYGVAVKNYDFTSKQITLGGNYFVAMVDIQNQMVHKYSNKDLGKVDCIAQIGDDQYIVASDRPYFHEVKIQAQEIRQRTLPNQERPIRWCHSTVTGDYLLSDLVFLYLIDPHDLTVKAQKRLPNGLSTLASVHRTKPLIYMSSVGFGWAEWNYLTGEVRYAELDDVSSPYMKGLDLSPDGTMLLTHYLFEKKVYLWDVESLQPIRVLHEFPKDRKFS